MIATTKTIAAAYWNMIREKGVEYVNGIISSLAAFDSLYCLHQETRDFLNHPQRSLENKKKLIHAFCLVEKRDTDVERLLTLLLQHHRLSDLEMVISYITAKRDEHFHFVSAVVSTVSSLSHSQKKELERQLQQSFQAEAVELTEKIDPNLLGGVVINVHGKVINGSLKTKLLRIQESLQ